MSNENPNPKNENPSSTVDEAKIEEMKKALLAPADASVSAAPSKKKKRTKSASKPISEEKLRAFQNAPIKGQSAVKRVFTAIILILTLCAALFGGWYYWWITHATFDYDLEPVIVLEGQTVTPDAFLTSNNSASLTAAFQNTAFEPTAGYQSVPLTLRVGERTLYTSGNLFVLTPMEHIRREFATEAVPLRPVDMLANADIAALVDFDISFVEEPLPLNEYPIGEFTLNVVLNGVPFDVVLIIEDNTPPTATAVNLTIPMSENVSPEDFVTDVHDYSPIASIEFVREPDVFLSGEQTVEVAISDIHDNTRIIAATLSVLPNEIPPRFEGLTEHIFGTVGEPLSLDEHIIALDAFDRELEFEVDTMDVDFDSTGTYTVIFLVTDNCGNQTVEEVTLELHNIDANLVNAQIDEILAEILTSEMTQVEEVQAIHNWVRTNLTFSASTPESEPETTLEGAHFALHNDSGNNFIFFSISEVLLTRAGIPNMRIHQAADETADDDDSDSNNADADTDDDDEDSDDEDSDDEDDENNGDENNVTVIRPPSPFTWNLINPDNLGWHHFDSMPTRLRIASQMYMFTQSQAEQFNREFERSGSPAGRYVFDPDGDFPDIVQ